MDDRLKKQIDFILEIDKEKNILRQTHLSGHGRRENDAEHAWHMAIMAYLLQEYSNEPVDIAKVMLMCLIHDVVEIDAGDTYAYDAEGLKTQKAREEAAKQRIYSLLPGDQKEKLQAAFDEFEDWSTPESRFAHAMDNFQPLLLNDSNDGGDWVEHGVCASQVYGRQKKTRVGSEVLYQATDDILKKNIEKGRVRPAYKMVIFDLDGTILDTLADLADSTNYALNQFGLPSGSYADVRRFTGNGNRVLIERLAPEGTPKEILDQVEAAFHPYYKDHCAIKTRPYDGIPELIQLLRARGILTAVVSNKADYAVRSLCEDQFPGMFDYVTGAQDGQRRKPYPDSVNAVLEQFGLDRSEAVYIGDSEVDIKTAENAEMDLIMVSWGFRDEEDIRSHGAKVVVHEPAEILDIVKVGTSNCRNY